MDQGPKWKDKFQQPGPYIYLSTIPEVYRGAWLIAVLVYPEIGLRGQLPREAGLIMMGSAMAAAAMPNGLAQLGNTGIYIEPNPKSLPGERTRFNGRLERRIDLGWIILNHLERLSAAAVSPQRQAVHFNRAGAIRSAKADRANIDERNFVHRAWEDGAPIAHLATAYVWMARTEGHSMDDLLASSHVQAKVFARAQNLEAEIVAAKIGIEGELFIKFRP